MERKLTGLNKVGVVLGMETPPTPPQTHKTPTKISLRGKGEVGVIGNKEHRDLVQVYLFKKKKKYKSPRTHIYGLAQFWS